MSKNLIVTANLYSIIWQHSADYGNYRQRYRILARDAQEAIAYTEQRAQNKAKLVKADLLCEDIEILITPGAVKGEWTEGNLPYKDDDVRQLLKQKTIDN